jgi:threonyl-tRNA synthetase
LRAALTACGLAWEELPGEGAFYGPKIEYHIKDALGRSWQCGTLQLDFVLPERLDAEYVADSNEKTRPVMLHRAILGSLERFIGILIENHAGAFPTWLAPVQVVVANITESQSAYVHDVVAQLKALGIRAEADTRNEKINYKIREHSLQKIPYQLVVGDKEKDSAAVAVRLRGEDLGAMPVVDLIARIQADILAK